MKEKAEKYAKSITKNETYQKYLIEAFLAGYKYKEKEITDLLNLVFEEKNKAI